MTAVTSGRKSSSGIENDIHILLSEWPIEKVQIKIDSFHHYIFVIAQLWLTSHPRSTVVLLDTGTQYQQRKGMSGQTINYG